MTIALRSFEKTLIETKPGVDKKQYVEQFAALALVGAPHGPYSTDLEFDEKHFQPAFTLVERLLMDSELVSRIPLAAASKDPEPAFEDLPPDVRALYENYPLVEGERVSTIGMLCLEKDWEGIAGRTVFVERETNLARVYFAVRGLRADPLTPGLTPAVLVRMPFARNPNAGPIAPVANAANDDSGPSFEEIGVPIITTFLEIVSTLSWVEPAAGPFVSAGITFLEAIMGAAISFFAPEKPSLLDNIQKIANGVVERIEYFQKETELKEQLRALTGFSDWITNVKKLLDTSDPASFSQSLTENSGILDVLTSQLGPKEKTSLFNLKSALYHDPDLGPGKAYESRRHWALASAKLRLLFLTTSEYLFAMKLKIILLAQLYEVGYDYHGVPIDRTKVADPDNTFSLLVAEIDGFKNEIPKFINNVRSRRAAMVVLEVNDNCEVAYSKDKRWIGYKSMRERVEQWKGIMNRRDALYTGYRYDQLVRSKEDDAPLSEFGTGVTSVFTANGNGGSIGDHVEYHQWQRTEVRDKAVWDGKTPQDWVLNDSIWGKSWSFNPNTERAEVLRQEYLPRILRDFDEWGKVPKVLGESITSLQDKWRPQLPAELLAGVLLVIAKWNGKAGKDELWSDKTVSVRYRFTVMSKIGKESEKSPEKLSTQWVEPEGKCLPEIHGLPTNGEYLKYIQNVCVYRQFRKELPNLKYKDGPERKVGVISRVKVEGQKESVFVGQWTDDQPVNHDKDELSHA